MATAVNIAGLIREALLKPAPPKVYVGRLVRETLTNSAQGSAVRVDRLVREALVAPPKLIVGGLVRETLIRVPIKVQAGNLVRETLLSLPTGRSILIRFGW